VIIGFELWKPESILITTPYQRSYKIVEETHNITIFAFPYVSLSGQSLHLGL